MYSVFAVIDLLRMIILHPDGATRLLKLVDKSGIFLRDILFVYDNCCNGSLLLGLPLAILDNILCAPICNFHHNSNGIKARASLGGLLENGALSCSG